MTQKLSAAQLSRRRRPHRHFTAQIFDTGTRLRLDENGRPLFCSSCRLPARECAVETFCQTCIETFRQQRQRDEEMAECEKRLGKLDATSPPVIRCTRCHGEIEGDAREAALRYPSFPRFEVWCSACIRHWLCEDVQLALDFNPERAAPRRRRVRQV